MVYKKTELQGARFLCYSSPRYATLLMPRIQTPYEVCHYKLLYVNSS